MSLQRSVARTDTMPPAASSRRSPSQAAVLPAQGRWRPKYPEPAYEHNRRTNMMASPHLESVLGADGQRAHKRVGAQVAHDHVHGAEEVGAHAIHLVHETDPRHLGISKMRPGREQPSCSSVKPHTRQHGADRLLSQHRRCRSLCTNGLHGQPQCRPLCIAHLWCPRTQQIVCTPTQAAPRYCALGDNHRMRPFAYPAHTLCRRDTHPVLVCLPPHGLGLRLHAGHTVKERHRAIQHTQRTLDLYQAERMLLTVFMTLFLCEISTPTSDPTASILPAILRCNAFRQQEASRGATAKQHLQGEVHVTRRVDDVDAVLLPEASGGGGGDGDATLPLL